MKQYLVLALVVVFFTSCGRKKEADQPPPELQQATDGNVEATNNWNRTWVFAVGILEYKYSSGWPANERQDEALVKSFESLGVPASQILHITDKQATESQLREQFSSFISKPNPGDSFVFYYAGHGENAGSAVGFVPYDLRSKSQLWLSTEILGALNTNFKGSQIMLFADACFSGVLCENAKAIKGKKTICASSVIPSILSTGNWTFTHSLVDAFSKKSYVDLNQDESISWSEIFEYSKRHIKKIESYDSHSSVNNDLLNSQAAVTRVPQKQSSLLGKLVEFKKSLDSIYDVKYRYYSGTPGFGKGQITEIFENGQYKIRRLSIFDNMNIGEKLYSESEFYILD